MYQTPMLRNGRQPSLIRFPSVTAPGAPQIAVERAYRVFDARALTP